mgnify:CR=1 FL=1
MNLKKTLPIIVMLPLLVSCGEKKLVIPDVDVDSITPNLPTRPNYNQGEIKTDGTYDYIDFYEVSDFHGAVSQGGSELGLAKLAGYLNIKRGENPGGTVVVSSGDMFQGSAESNLTRGYMVNYSMNYMGFDSMALGNHEFDWTDKWIEKNANLAYSNVKIPYLCANLIDKRTNSIPNFVSKSTVISRGDYKIGIIGSIGDGLKTSILASCVANYDFLEEKSIVEAEAARLRSEDNCDIVVWTTHNGLDDVVTVNGVDAIFGGHAHENALKNVGSIPAVATSNYGKSIGHIQLKIDASKNVSLSKMEIDSNPTSLSGLKENQDIKKIMNGYSAEIDKIKNIKLGKAEGEFKADKTLKNVCVEAMFTSALKANKDNNLGLPEDHIIAAFHNINGGIRSDIPEGEITYGTVYSPFPFDNEIVFYKVKGFDFKAMMGQFSSYAVCRTFKSADEIISNQDYYLILTDFIALSKKYVKGIFPTISDKDLIRTGKVVRDEVAQFIYEKDKINPDDFLIGKGRYEPIPMA